MTTDKDTRLSAGDKMPRTARERLLASFDAMLLRRDRGRQRASAIAAEAGVARTTFYDHFQSTSDLKLAAVQRPLEAMAELATGAVCSRRLERWVTHFWEYRAECRMLIAGPERQPMERLLASLIGERLPDNEHLFFSTQASAVIVVSLDEWFNGRVRATPAELVRNLSRACAALRFEVVSSHCCPDLSY